ncbi:MAG: Glyceraldehyde-3-phosphate dehydrogenase [Candidatus Heimdallarchaeota archaeon LC_2]|nr:MAG: Glyceraldehyde-3-phosphate dehydrogenase [Candidatus Heimdallarchaeota archaeon LC_2]
MSTVLVNGTGTIGEPLIALLLSMKEKLEIENLVFYKHTPRLIDRPMLNNLIAKGGKLCVSEDKMDDFKKMGIEASYTWKEALEMADVVADATKENVGMKNKEEYYKKAEKNTLGFLAQGSESDFGIIYAAGINDNIFENDRPKYLQIASCNTHAAAAGIKYFASHEDGSSNLDHADLTFIRRGSDVSQTRGVQAPTVTEYEDDRFGTHHAKDVWKLFQTKGLDLNIFSSALKINSQYMHTLAAHLQLNEPVTREYIMNILDKTAALAQTNKTAVNQVFSFGRDHGHFGRILNQSVFVKQSIKVHENHLYYWSFTPQDGNAILSSVKAIMHHLYEDNDKVERLMKYADPWLFNEV